MDILWHELVFGLPDARRFAQVLIRLVAATLLGALVGFQREQAGKAAGFRTHILVSIGTAVIVLAYSGASTSVDGLSRVIQGIVTGIGFLGAGSILKLSQEHQIKGLTTAASIWMTAAIGIAVGIGSIGLALITAILTLIVLVLALPFEHRARARRIASEQEQARQENAQK